MDRNHFDINHLGDSISQLVDDAVNSQNFKELSNTISNTITQAVDGINKAVEGTTKRPESRTYTNSGRQNGHPYVNGRQSQPANNQPMKAPCTVRPGGQIAASIKTLIGFTFGGMGGIAALVLTILAFFGFLNVGTVIALSIVCLLFIGGMALGFSGAKGLARIKRFRQYLSIIGTKNYIELETLVKATGRSKKFLLNDLRAMTERKLFKQAHFDQSESCLMLTDEVYHQYQETMSAAEEQRKQDQKMADAGLTQEVMDVISQSEGYIRKIREANDALPGEMISSKLARLELVITRILEEVKKQPSKASDLQKFLNYYLPTTWKLINAYLEFEKQPLQTDNIVSTKKEIEETLDTINSAFEKLLDDLFQTQAWDISSDISVLETMFVQEGLTNSGLNRQTKTGTNPEKQ